MVQKSKSGIFLKIMDLIKQIPEGSVTTYGQIAHMAGTQNPRLVGYALSSLKEETDVPWFRVINSKGKISFPEDSDAYRVQKSLLENEGIVFDQSNRISFKKHGWKIN